MEVRAGSPTITAAYSIVVSKYGEVKKTEIMTLAQIHQSWKQSRTPPFDNGGKIKSNSVHAKFPEAMCCKSVIARACKPIINSSDDKGVLVDSIKAAEQLSVTAENEADYIEHANIEMIDVEIAPSVSEEGSKDEPGGEEHIIGISSVEETPPIEEHRGPGF